MLLVIDVGNTNTVFGLYADATGMRPDDGLRGHFRVATDTRRTADELSLLIRQFINLHDLESDDITAISVASVVPAVSSALRTLTEQYFRAPVDILRWDSDHGLTIAIDDPTEVGPDRIANAVAAHALYGVSTIVVDFGTATTIDVVTDDQRYLGGAISPGVQISLEALATRAAALKNVELTEPPSVIGTNTTNAVRSGMLFGTTAQIEGLIDRFQKELAQTGIGPCQVVATGGLAGLIAPLTSVFDHTEPWLTLHGLRLLQHP